MVRAFHLPVIWQWLLGVSPISIVCRGNVAIINSAGNATYSETVVYYAKDGRIVIGGDAEAVFQPGTEEDFDY